MVRDSREAFKTWQGVFDNFTLRVIHKLSGQEHFGDLVRVISPGKEAIVFTADKDDGVVAVKIYRLETAKFTKMFSYIRVDPRYSTLKNNQRQVIFSWTEREYRNMLLARQAGVRVPMPIAHKDNVLVMEFIGHGEVASPILKDRAPEDVERFATASFDAVVRYAKAGFVHGDLSEYNIINHDDEPVLIDFSHGVPLKAPNSWELLRRDIENLVRYFSRLGVACDTEELLARCRQEAPAARP